MLMRCYFWLKAWMLTKSTPFLPATIDMTSNETEISTRNNIFEYGDWIFTWTH